MTYSSEELRRLHEAATPEPWGIWFETINGQADKAISELIEQVHATDPIGNSLVMLDADGKCPAVTGCGPTSANNAALIASLRNAVPAILAQADENKALLAEIARKDEALAEALPWLLFYRDGKNLGEIAEEVGGTIYNYSPRLTAPIIRAVISELEPTIQQHIAALEAEIARKDDALAKARDTFSWYGELHAAKPDPEKAARNIGLACEMSAALAPANKETDDV